MKAVLDTNVFVSGIVWQGPPAKIVRAWRDGNLDLIISHEILDEYQRVAKRLMERYPTFDLTPFIDLVVMEAAIHDVPPTAIPECPDPKDVMFLTCALATRTKFIVSGDKHLLSMDGYGGIEIASPKTFVDRYLNDIS